MLKRLSQSDNSLYTATDEILHYLWDPIGIAGHPGTRDEYHAYLPHIFSLLKDGSDPGKIAAHLTLVTTQSMGLSANVGHDLKVANALVKWRDCLSD